MKSVDARANGPVETSVGPLGLLIETVVEPRDVVFELRGFSAKIRFVPLLDTDEVAVFTIEVVACGWSASLIPSVTNRAALSLKSATSSMSAGAVHAASAWIWNAAISISYGVAVDIGVLVFVE